MNGKIPPHLTLYLQNTKKRYSGFWAVGINLTVSTVGLILLNGSVVEFVSTLNRPQICCCGIVSRDYSLVAALACFCLAQQQLCHCFPVVAFLSPGNDTVWAIWVICWHVSWSRTRPVSFFEAQSFCLGTCFVASFCLPLFISAQEVKVLSSFCGNEGLWMKEAGGIDMHL